RSATSAWTCTRSSGGDWPNRTRASFCRASSSASSSERCCTPTFARSAFRGQYVCFTAATVCTADSRNCSSELSSFRFVMISCWLAESIVRSFSSGCENATRNPDCTVGSKLFRKLLLVVRDASHDTLHVPFPHGTRWRTPVDENQSRLSTLLVPSRKLVGAASTLDRPNSVEKVGV